MSNNNHSNEFLFSEAPASWNTRYVDPNGFECQLTLRADIGQELLEKVSGAIAYLLKNDCQPYHYKVGYQGNNKHNQNSIVKEQGSSKQSEDDASWCPIHECHMRRWEKDGRAWYSHKVNGEWCSGE